MSEADLIETLAELQPGSPVASVRGERADIARHTQRAYEAVISPIDPGGLSLAERAAIGCEVAYLHGDGLLADHYAALIAQRGGTPGGGRWAAISTHVSLVSTHPRDASPAALDTLRHAGLGEREIVALSQIIGFVSYQVRVLAGLRAMERIDG